MVTTDTRTVAPWRVFEATVGEVTRLSPSFRRITLVGEDLEDYADIGPDARVKVVLPLPDTGYAHVPRGESWYDGWRALPDDRRNPIRTYTTRAVRRPLAADDAGVEVDLDMVVHGDTGPASRWATAARVGDPLVLVGPDRRSDGPHGGVEFRQPGPDRPVLLAGDETAVPAITSILEHLPRDTVGSALLEVPRHDDRWQVDAPEGMHLTWLAREGADHGSLLVPAVQAAAALLHADGRGTTQRGEAAGLADVDVDHDLLWEVPEDPDGCRGLYAWLAGEAAMIRTLRRHLVGELGVDRRSVAFMGYWRAGRAEGA